MNRLQKFVERGAFGEGPGRTAYVLNPMKLPDPSRGFEWAHRGRLLAWGRHLR